ncbi:MAG: hypothetical protein M1835_002241 [Candelina submexicana]|nr:MAG: hypothetical protein M1835_002241 [Candelina submexicana]
MAGHHHNTLAMDPALVKYASMLSLKPHNELCAPGNYVSDTVIDMYVNRHKYFRWTPRTAWLTFVYVVAVPSIFGYMGYVTDGKWDMRGKRRGDMISEF